MHVVHSHYNKHVDEHTDRPVSFCISNKKGGYLALGDEHFTQMQGLFFFDTDAWSPYKCVENLRLDSGVKMLGIRNHFHSVERFYVGGAEEEFTLFNNSMIYSLHRYQGEVSLELDFRHLFDFDERGRIYSVEKARGDLIVIRYDKYSDDSRQHLDRTRFLVIKGASGFSPVGSWEHKRYEYDAKRGSKSEFYTYTALKLHSDGELHLAFTFGTDKDACMAEAGHSFENRKSYLHAMKKYMDHSLQSGDLAFDAAMKALDDLLVTVDPGKEAEGQGKKARTGVFAGLPWFYQFWSRDELISLRALMIDKKYKRVKDILFSYLDAIGDDGLLPNRLPSSEVKSVDATGWLFIRIHDLLADLARDRLVEEYLNVQDLIRIRQGLEKALRGMTHHKSRDGFIVGNLQESWMDTKEARRSGAFIESQAFLLAMMRLHNELSRTSGSRQLFSSMEDDFAMRVKESFFKDGRLMDSLGGELPEETVRPNIFLAYYAYPNLLSLEEWKSVFDKVLDETWLDWGALASISHKSPYFRQEYTGQDDQSYHNGDSWYFVNNIAAIAMHRLDKYRYAKYINRILHASREELLFSGFVGCSSEISSAKAMRSEGCLSQAWSAATLVELLHELR